MNLKTRITIIAVLLMGTAIFTIFVFIPQLKQPVELAKTEPVQVDIEKISYVDELFELESNTFNVQILNRDLPPNWLEKQILLTYTYVGEYEEGIESQVDDLLGNEYNWKKQLDEDGSILWSGVLVKVDDIFQYHTHNGYSFGEKYYLFGDILHRYHRDGVLEGTEINIGGQTFVAIWEKEVRYLEDSSISAEGIDLIISTCLKTRTDKRLVSGWKIKN